MNTVSPQNQDNASEAGSLRATGTMEEPLERIAL